MTTTTATTSAASAACTAMVPNAMHKYGNEVPKINSNIILPGIQVPIVSNAFSGEGISLTHRALSHACAGPNSSLPLLPAGDCDAQDAETEKRPIRA